MADVHQVVNAGISGHTSSQLLERLERDVLQYRPAVVVLWIGTNDAMLVAREDGGAGDRPNDKPAWVKISGILTAFLATKPGMRLRTRKKRSPTHPEKLVSRVSLDVFSRNVDTILHRLEEAAVDDVLIIGLPEVPDSFSPIPALVKRQRKRHLEYDRVLADKAAAKGHTFIPLWGRLCDKHFLVDGLHLSPQGCSWIADQVLDAGSLSVREDSRLG